MRLSNMTLYFLGGVAFMVITLHAVGNFVEQTVTEVQDHQQQTVEVYNEAVGH